MADKVQLDRKSFLERYRFSAKELETAGLTWDVLDGIYCRHIARSVQLQKTADYITGRLREVDTVHSVKVRVKHPERLVAKIVRKRLGGGLEGISEENYTTFITDLIGLRALHLFKGDWLPIHSFVSDNWALAEKPIAYIREGDSEIIRKAFDEAGCTVTIHQFGYRSLHYLIKSQPALETHVAELQVRTLFEEAWSEVDHRVRYPRESDNIYLADFLNLFNRIAGSADEMGTFIQSLAQYVARQELHQEQSEKQLKDTISKLKLSEAEKRRLAEQVDGLRKSTVGPLGTTGYTIQASATPSPTSSIFSTAFPSTTAWGLGALAGTTKTCAKCGKQYSETLSTIVSATNLCPSCQFRGLLGS